MLFLGLAVNIKGRMRKGEELQVSVGGSSPPAWVGWHLTPSQSGGVRGGKDKALSTSLFRITRGSSAAGNDIFEVSGRHYSGIYPTFYHI